MPEPEAQWAMRGGQGEHDPPRIVAAKLGLYLARLGEGCDESGCAAPAEVADSWLDWRWHCREHVFGSPPDEDLYAAPGPCHACGQQLIGAFEAGVSEAMWLWCYSVAWHLPCLMRVMKALAR